MTDRCEGCPHSLWRSFDGQELYVCELDDKHLLNLHRFLLERELELAEMARLPVGLGTTKLPRAINAQRRRYDDLIQQAEGELEKRDIEPHLILRDPKEQPIHRGAL